MVWLLSGPSLTIPTDRTALWHQRLCFLEAFSLECVAGMKLTHPVDQSVADQCFPGPLFLCLGNEACLGDGLFIMDIVQS